MSKAFTRESDDIPDLPRLPSEISPLPPGAKNYLTPDGARRLSEELERLVQVERPRIAASASEQGRKSQLQNLDYRIRRLEQSVQTAEVVSPPAGPENRVRFGAAVTARDRHGVETRYRIVGVDEVDLDRGWVSWLSPVAKALLKGQLGERVRVNFPSGPEELEIVSIVYE